MDLKVLLLDIETIPLLSNTWGLYDQNISVNQIEKDWAIIAWAAKWLGHKKMFYQDQRKAKDIRNEKQILKKIWQLIDKADVVVTQNGEAFDLKKLNARFIHHGFKPPSSYKSIDTKKIAKNKFGFTSNGLEYLSKTLTPDTKKQDHKKFPGFELWKQCMQNNPQAWNEMRKYNIQDVLALEALYNKLKPWDARINFYAHTGKCQCGSVQFQKNGFSLTEKGRYQRYKCASCGYEYRDGKNHARVDKKG